MNIKSFLISVLIISICIINIIALSVEKATCDGVLARGVVWYVCVKDSE